MTRTEEMCLINAPLTLIVAATKKNGIGKAKGLPWPMLKKEMAYFARTTKRVPSSATPGSRNVVLMGRKTWESIPAKLRPLKDRINIVISSQNREKLVGITDEVVVASDISSGLSKLEGLVREKLAPPVGRAFVVGGTSIYAQALGLPQAKHILLTRIHTDYECDTFFPVDMESAHDEGSGWTRKAADELSAFVGEDVPVGLMQDTGNGESVEFEFQLFERP